MSKNIYIYKKSGAKSFFKANFWIEHTSKIYKISCERKNPKDLFFGPEFQFENCLQIKKMCIFFFSFSQKQNIVIQSC